MLGLSLQCMAILEHYDPNISNLTWDPIPRDPIPASDMMKIGGPRKHSHHGSDYPQKVIGSLGNLTWEYPMFR